MMTEGMLLAAVLAVAIPQATTTEAPTIHVDSAPVIEIGASATDPEDQLFDVGAVLRTPSGGFLIVERAAGRLRLYDSEGGFVRDLGGLGDGPGEFREILDAALRADTVVVLDRDGSVTSMALNGTVIDTRRTDYLRLTDDRFNPVPHGVLPDGQVVIRAQERVFGRPDGEYVQQVGWLIVDPAGPVDTVGFFPSHRLRSDDGVPRPYRPWVDAAFGVGPDAFWVSLPVESRLQESEGGRVIEVERHPGSPSEEDLAWFRERYVGRGASDNDRRVIAEWVDGAPVAERLPGFRRFTVDGLGRVWIERWPTKADHTIWEVRGPTGKPIAVVALPFDLRLESAGADWITGVWTDPFGVERVRMYGLRLR